MRIVSTVLEFFHAYGQTDERMERFFIRRSAEMRAHLTRTTVCFKIPDTEDLKMKVNQYVKKMNVELCDQSEMCMTITIQFVFLPIKINLFHLSFFLTVLFCEN
jgi:hypothetical protein